MKRAWLVVVVALSACWPFDFDQLAAQHADAGAIGGGAAPGGGPGGGSAVGGGSAGGGTVAGGGSNTGGGDDAGTPAGGGSPAGGGTSAGGGSAPGGGGATGGGTSTGGGSASGGGTGTGGGTASSDAGTCFGVNGWCWQHPWPVGVPLTAVYARAPNDVWFGGNGGVLLHLTDAGLQFVSATSEFSNTVQQILPVNVLVGSGNAVLAVQGLNYASVSDEAVWVITPGGATEVGRGLLSTTPYYAATTSTGRVYLAGSSSTVEALDPPTYTPIKQRSSFTEAIIGLAVDRNDECYVTRIDYTPSPNQHMLTECSNPNRWVFPTAWSEPNWLWAGADALNIVFETDVTVQAADHYFDGGFSDGGVSPAFSIEHAFTGSDNVAFGVGSVTFVKRTPAGWVSVAPSGFDATLWAVHGTDSTNVWAVGEGGRIYNIDDAGFHQFSRSVISDYVTKLFGTETWVVASQNYGPAMIKDQTPWRSLNTARCRGGWCNGSTCICATDSQQRTQFSFDGGTWLQSPQSFPQNLWDGWFDTLDHSWFLEGPSSHSVRVVQGDVRQASATYFADVCQTPDAGLLAIHGAAGNAWVVGENGCVAELLVDGGVRSHDLTSVGSLHSVMAVGPGHAWVMSDDTAYELNDGGVTSYPVPFPSQYGSARPLWVDSSGVWVGGPNSVFHLDDAGVWQREVIGIGPARTQSDFQVTALFGNSQGLWVGGQSGSILFKHR